MKRFICSSLLLIVFSLPLASQTQNRTSKRTRIAKQSVTVDGDRGLFTIPSVETLNKGQYSFGAAVSNIDRTPKDLDITSFPVHISIGVLSRLTLGASFEAQKQVTARNLAQPGFNSGLPFAGNGGNKFEKSYGDTTLSAKYRLNRKPDNVGGMAIRGFVKLGTADPVKGLGSGATDVGADIIFTTILPLNFVLQSNIGGTATHDSKKPFAVVNKDEMRSGFGAAWPSTGIDMNFMPSAMRGSLQGIIEYANLTYIGASSVNLATTKVQNPTDVNVGLRYLMLDHGVTLDFGYRTNTKFDMTFPGNTDHRGFVFSASFTKPQGVRLSGNHSPIIALETDAEAIPAGGTALITATGFDADNDMLTYIWTTSGGQVSGNGEKATFRAAGAAPGKYTIHAVASDGKGGTAESEVEITVRP